MHSLNVSSMYQTKLESAFCNCELTKSPTSDQKPLERLWAQGTCLLCVRPFVLSYYYKGEREKRKKERKRRWKRLIWTEYVGTFVFLSLFLKQCYFYVVLYYHNRHCKPSGNLKIEGVCVEGVCKHYAALHKGLGSLELLFWRTNSLMDTKRQIQKPKDNRIISASTTAHICW